MKTIQVYKNVAYYRKSNLNLIVLYFWVLIVMIFAFSDFGDGKTQTYTVSSFCGFILNWNKTYLLESYRRYFLIHSYSVNLQEIPIFASILQQCKQAGIKNATTLHSYLQ